MQNSAATSPPFYRQTSLGDVQAEPVKILGLGLTALAWLTHEAEYEEDDLTFIAIQNSLADSSWNTLKIYRDEYMRLLPEHAEFRGYAE